MSAVRSFPVTRASQGEGDLQLDAEVVVVGSGAGGAVVAALCAEAGQDVLVLEEGPYVAAERYATMRPSETMRHMWRDAGLTFSIPGRDSPTINVMMGRCVGGSSVMTGGVCFRVPGFVYEAWTKERGLTELSEAGLAPAYDEVERAVHVEEVPASLRSRSAQLFARGAEKLGLTVKPLRRNTDGCKGHGRCNFGCPETAKMSVDVSYLPRAVKAGARVYSDALVQKIVVRAGRAVGVEGRTANGRKLSVRAKRVVVAAGAYHSPLLLKSSGVGKRSGQVGKNLTLHPAFRVMARFDEPVQGWKGALQSVFIDAFEHERITLVNMFTPPGVLAATMPGIGPHHVERAANIPHLAMFGGMIHDDGGGTVHRGLGREPLVRYTMGKADRAAVPVLMRKMAEIYFAAGAREVFLPILGFGGITADQLASAPLENIPGHKLESGSQHPLGTCRMGTSPESSVVDVNGKAWDVDELYLADGSVVPTSLGVNPQLTIMAMATRIAWKLRERRPS